MAGSERDIHVVRYFSSCISVSDGAVINVTEPTLSYCPLAAHLYTGFKAVDGTNKDTVKNEIKKVVEFKIREFGFFSPRRVLSAEATAIPYGASEMMMFALNKKTVDAAVVVCDGAGTIITDEGEIVQGVGARMNMLLLTSPIREVKERLKERGCRVVFENALIDQAQGVKKAIEAGYKRIVVTVGGHDAEKLKRIRMMESAGLAITILVVCTTGVTGAQVEQIGRFADLVWSCASWDIRRTLGARAIVQVSQKIPVFVLTRRGIDFLAAYAHDGTPFKTLDSGAQYLISHRQGGRAITLGAMAGFLSEAKLPVVPQASPVMAET